MSIGEKIKKLRKDNKLTQEALANKLAVSRRTVIDWENDKYHPQTELLLKISDVFNIPLSELTGTVEKEEIVANDIKNDFLCINNMIYGAEKKRLKGKYKNNIKASDRIALILLAIIYVPLLILVAVLKGLESSLLLIVLSFVIVVMGIRILKDIKYNDLINRYEYIKNNNKGSICLSPYLEVVANVSDRLIISYNKKIIISVPLTNILDIRLYRDSIYFPLYFPNDIDNKTYIYGMHIVYNDSTFSKIAFSVEDKRNGVFIRKIMNDSFNMLKSCTKKGV